MQATLMHALGDVRIEDVPDPSIIEPTDAVLRVTRACICGSDLWPYASMERSDTGQSMGHEAIGVVEDVGAQVTKIKKGDVVVTPFAHSDGTYAFGQEGLPTACVQVGFFGNNGVNGAQAEALRIPLADGTLYPLPVGEDDALMPSLLTLSDVMGTGHYAAVVAGVAPGKRAGCRRRRSRPLRGHRRQAARRRADHHHGRHPDRIALAREFGATDVVSERGEEGVERASTSSPAARASTRCSSASATARRWRPRSASPAPVALSAASAPPAHRDSGSEPAFFGNVTIGGGPAPVRAYLDELLPEVLEGRIDPGRVFDRTVGMDDVPDGYRAMADREAIKVMVQP